jgi:hypothetical protein
MDETIYLAVEHLNGYYYIYCLDFENDKVFVLPICIDDAIEEHQQYYGFTYDEAVEVILNDYLDQAIFLDGWIKITELRQV